MKEKPHEITNLLIAWRNGDSNALNQIIQIVYETLYQIARGFANKQDLSQKLQPTEIINLAYLRLVGQNQIEWQNRKHFYVIVAREMRRVLVDHYRQRITEKRGGDFEEVPFIEDNLPKARRDLTLLELNEVLDQLAILDERQAQIVDLTFFAGNTNQEIADVLGISLSTVERELRHAKYWLRQRLNSPAKQKI